MHSSARSAQSFAGSLLLISPFFLWGTAMVAMKGTIDDTTPFFLAGVRLLPAGFLVLLAAVYLGRSQPRGWRAWSWILLFALIDGTMFQGFLAEGLTRTGAGLGSVMIDSQPLAVAVMARFLFEERVGPFGWLGLGIGLLGISLLGLPDPWIWGLFNGQSPLTNGTLGREVLTDLFQQGEWLMLMAALSMAVGTVLIRFVSRHADPIAATGWHMVLGGLPLFALSAWQETAQWQGVSISGWMSIAYATIFGSAIAYGVFFYLAAQGNLTSLSSLTFLTPVFALVFGMLLLSESLSLLQWMGVGLTLVSIYLINQRAQLESLITRPSPAVPAPEAQAPPVLPARTKTAPD
ncbi:DMT family transporter [Romeria aff. gracilis LEGE 07310]|uniref:DMT family transporter n=1 Tax=Vasconcelosia minhoensis LEGE 07310 TaxID=915328 RepID=A0A8J7AL26_9CYAN|nr:DMT family transporter [Romeria gracilis]MBE9076629.1 DMT family transporter [Romeria aff. gracilis LEGE 07310]